MLQLSMPLILASGSIGRQILLKQLGLPIFKVVIPKITETHFDQESVRQATLRLAEQKLHHVCHQYQPETQTGAYLVLAGDTIVSVGRRKLEKPSNSTTARDYLWLLSGRRHRVTSAVAIAKLAASGQSPDWVKTRVAQAIVQFKRLDVSECNAYIQTDEWRGKAGGYDLQGSAQALIKRVIGAPSIVIGLPLFETRQLLIGTGVAKL